MRVFLGILYGLSVCLLTINNPRNRTHGRTHGTHGPPKTWGYLIALSISNLRFKGSGNGSGEGRSHSIAQSLGGLHSKWAIPEGKDRLPTINNSWVFQRWSIPREWDQRNICLDLHGGNGHVSLIKMIQQVGSILTNLAITLDIYIDLVSRFLSYDHMIIWIMLWYFVSTPFIRFIRKPFKQSIPSKQRLQLPMFSPKKWVRRRLQWKKNPPRRGPCSWGPKVLLPETCWNIGNKW